MESLIINFNTNTNQMETIRTIGRYALAALAIAGIIAAAMLVVYIGINIFWIFAAAGFVM